MNLELSTPSTLVDGTTITKKEILEYFVRFLKALDKYDSAVKRLDEYEPKISALELDSRRRTFPISRREPPRGLSALSPRKRKEYQEWLDSAPKREAEIREKEQAEDARLKEVAIQLDNLRKLREQDRIISAEAKNELDAISDEGVLPQDYMKPEIILLLAKFFVTNRAHTLTDAINLYHQELHWQQMNEMQQQQMRDSAAAHRALAIQNQIHTAQIIAGQREAAAELRSELDDIRRAANDAKFYAEMCFLYDLF